jgi:pilus assembly protein FimV
MVAKRSSRALALLLALPTAALALGLGDIRLLSPLNAPLDAEVELVDVAPDEANTVTAQLASRETFARYGLDWPAYLAGVQVRTVRAPDGRQMLKLRSTEAISEPFITLLVEVNWARGHLVREYTMLLDPPVYTPGQSAVAGSPVSAPATGSGTREGAIARAGDATPAPAAAAPAAAAPESSAASGAPPARARAAGADSDGGSMHVVQRGETLSAIASSEAGAGANTPRTRSLMVAIYQANPRAFEKNMNVLHSGALLRIPDATEAAAVSPSTAAAEISRQYAAWRSGAGAAAAPSGERPGRLKLVTPSESPSVGATPGATPSAEVGQLQGRVHDLEGQLAESKRLLELKSADLARMQETLAAKQAQPAPSAPPPPREAAPPPPVAPPVAQAPVEQAPAAPPAPPPSIAEEKPPQTAPQTAAEAPPPRESAKPAPTPAPPAAGGSLFDTLMGYWWQIGLLVLVLVGVAAARIVRSRRAAQFDDSLGRLAVASSDTGVFAPGRGFGSAQPTQAGTSPEPAFLVEETGTHERPRFPAAGTQAAPAARHVTSDDTISSETAINLDQGDPLAEADFHMAYGLYDQAADLIRIAIGREPARRDLRLKLLEVFFVWGNKDQFLTAARELADSRGEAAPGEWEKILIMGKQLAPDDPLFSGAGAVSGATAGGVDLDLEGGQSRVDFDLMGEPPAGEATQRVDLDLGAAFGDRTTESPTGVTDSNAALAESSFAGATGTTRQMTARMRHDGGLGLSSTGEMEGPTVEQPTIAATQETPTIRQKVESALKQSVSDQTAELAIDDLGLDVGQVDTVDQPGLAAASSPDAPTLVAGLDEHSRHVMEDAQHRREETGAWQFDHDELEAARTQTSQAMPDSSATSRLAALGAREVDVDLGDSTGTHPAVHTGGLDLDVGGSTGAHAANGGGLDLDVGTATVPDTAFAATQRLSSEDLALPDLEPVTMSEVGTKLDLARAYMDMGDPDGARNILEEVLAEGSAAQKQEAQRLMESLPG